VIAISEQMREVSGLIRKFAFSRNPILIHGETGTGKEVAACAIHAHSPWSKEPFVAVDCGALSPTLIESEFFGHVRGAFTGATEARKGLLASAGRGTIFFDEVAEIPVGLQVKLLRAIQEREIKPLGSDRPLHFEARIIAAMNQNPEIAVRNGSLREDLYFRLNVLSIKLPPLRERKQAIPALAHYFLGRHAGAEGEIRGISYEAMGALTNYDWPGNIRELENCIQRALALASPPAIQVRDLPPRVVGENVSIETRAITLKELERGAILKTLELTGGDRLRAARVLGIGKTTMYRKLKEFGVALPANLDVRRF
jgi:transcriptional regulator with PAS, ATPase and Fis domain